MSFLDILDFLKTLKPPRPLQPSILLVPSEPLKLPK